MQTTRSSCSAAFGDAAHQSILGMAFTPSGDLLVVGNIEGSAVIGGKAIETDLSGLASFVARFDVACNLVYVHATSRGLLDVTTNASGKTFVASNNVDVATGKASTDIGLRISALDETGAVTASKMLVDYVQTGYPVKMQSNGDGVLVSLTAPQNAKLATGTVLADDSSHVVMGVGPTPTLDIAWAAHARRNHAQLDDLGVTSDGEGGAVVAGSAFGSLTLVDGDHACNQGCLASIGPDGKARWFTTPKLADGARLTRLPSGDFVGVVRPTSGVSLAGATPQGAGDLVFVRIAKADGTLSNGRLLGTKVSPDGRSALAIVSDSKGKIWLAGDARNEVLDLGTTHVEKRIFLAELAEDGSAVRSAVYGDASGVFGAMAVDALDDVGLAGGLFGKTDFGGGRTLANPFWPTSDAFFVRAPALDVAPMAARGVTIPSSELIYDLNAAGNNPFINPVAATTDGVFFSDDAGLYLCASPPGSDFPKQLADSIQGLGLDDTGDVKLAADGVDLFVASQVRGILKCSTSACADFATGTSRAVTLDTTTVYFELNGAYYSCPRAGCPAEGPKSLPGLGPASWDSIAVQGNQIFAAVFSPNKSNVVRATLPDAIAGSPLFSSETLVVGVGASSSGLLVALSGSPRLVQCPLSGSCAPHAVSYGWPYVLGETDVYSVVPLDVDANYVVVKCPQTGCPPEGPKVVAAAASSNVALATRGSDLFVSVRGKIRRYQR